MANRTCLKFQHDGPGGCECPPLKAGTSGSVTTSVPPAFADETAPEPLQVGHGVMTVTTSGREVVSVSSESFPGGVALPAPVTLHDTPVEGSVFVTARVDGSFDFGYLVQDVDASADWGRADVWEAPPSDRLDRGF
jgi:hypothetical protein